MQQQSAHGFSKWKKKKTKESMQVKRWNDAQNMHSELCAQQKIDRMRLNNSTIISDN